MKVIITKVAGQTGLRKVGTELDVSNEIGDRWVKAGFVSRKNPPRKKKKKDGTASKQSPDSNK